MRSAKLPKNNVPTINYDPDESDEELDLESEPEEFDLDGEGSDYQEDWVDPDDNESVLDDTITYMLNKAGRYPRLGKDQQLVLTKQVFAGKIALLAKIAPALFSGIDENSTLTDEQHEVIFLKFDFLIGWLMNDGLLEKSDPDYVALKLVRDKLVQHNQRLVVKLAKKFYFSGKFTDSIQEGMIGLMKSIERFDHRRGIQFGSYASWWIRKHIGLAHAEDTMVRLPVHTTDKLTAIRKQRRINPQVTDSQLAEILGLSLEQVIDLHDDARMLKISSLDVPLKEASGKDGAPLISFLKADGVESVDTQVLNKLASEQMVGELEALLSKRECHLIFLRLGLEDDEERKLQEIGDTVGISRERVRQLIDRAYEKVHPHMLKYA